MQGYRFHYLGAAFVAAIILMLTTQEVCFGALPNTGDTVFTAVDLTTVSLPPGSRGVEPSPFIIWRDNSINSYFAWLMTLSSQTGARLGQRLLIYFSEEEVPVNVTWSRHMLEWPSRGVEPSPFIIFRNFKLQYHIVTYNFDGTPVIESTLSQLLSINPVVYGFPTCMTEMPGIAFDDGYPRLCIGTDNGHLILLINTFVAGIQVDEIVRPVLEPIGSLTPVPQYGFIALGVLSGRTIRGLDFRTNPAKMGTDSYTLVFQVSDPRPEPLTGFDVFGPQDEPVIDPDGTVRIVLANGTEEIALAGLSAVQTDSIMLEPSLETHDNAVQSVAAGSLLMLSTDGSGIRYDPSYSPETGASGCDIDITDGIDDDCAAVCGDANGDGDVNVGDAVFVISYVFKGGPAPDPVCAGDANGDGDTNVGDAVYLISYVFKGGPPPVENCCP